MSNKLIATSTLATALLIGGLTNPYGNNLIAQASAYGTDLYEAASERVHGAVLTQPGVLSLNTVGVQNFDERFAVTQVFAKHLPGKHPSSTKGIQYQAPVQGEQSTRPYQYNHSRKSHRPEQRGRTYRSDEASRPNQSRKPATGTRIVALATSALSPSVEQGLLRSKGIQHRPSVQGEKPGRGYQYNDARKSHRAEKAELRYQGNEASAPVRSRKLGSGARFVSLDSTRYDRPQFVAAYADGFGQPFAEQMAVYTF